MKIGILTYHRSVNYGAFLQAYCLAKYIKGVLKNKAEIEIIDYTSIKAMQYYNSLIIKGISKRHELKKRMSFIRSSFLLPLSKEKIYSDDIEEIRKYLERQNYDLIIVGSDEIWKVNGMRGFPNAYWLNFELNGCIRMSYAASSRTPFETITKEKIQYIKEATDRFTYIGVRDAMTFDMLEQIGVKKVYLNCDPTFLISFSYDKEKFKDRLYKRFKISSHTKIIGVMIPDNKLITKIKKRMGNRYKVIALNDYHQDADYNCIDINPFEWIKILGVLDYFVSDRFHGIVFAIKMSIPFLAIETYDKAECSKLKYLLESNGLKTQYFSKPKMNLDYEKLVEKIEEDEKNFERPKLLKVVQREKRKADSFKKKLLEIVEDSNNETIG